MLAAALLSSLAPPSKYLGEEGSALAKVGPGPVAATVQQGPYTLKVLVKPNKAAAPNDFALQITKDGQPVTGADVTVTFEMLDMEMGNQEYQLSETAPGVYSHPAPALVMVGHWGLTFNVTPKNGAAVLRPRRRPRQRMTAAPALRLFASALGFAAGVIAVVIAILLLRTALG